eukprot:1161748-Pelagomonas_calceolata.AAC.9
MPKDKREQRRQTNRSKWVPEEKEQIRGTNTCKRVPKHKCTDMEVGQERTGVAKTPATTVEVVLPTSNAALPLWPSPMQQHMLLLRTEKMTPAQKKAACIQESNFAAGVRPLLVSLHPCCSHAASPCLQLNRQSCAAHILPFVVKSCAAHILPFVVSTLSCAACVCSFCLKRKQQNKEESRCLQERQGCSRQEGRQGRWRQGRGQGLEEPHAGCEGHDERQWGTQPGADEEAEAMIHRQAMVAAATSIPLILVLNDMPFSQADEEAEAMIRRQAMAAAARNAGRRNSGGGKGGKGGGLDRDADLAEPGSILHKVVYLSCSKQHYIVLMKKNIWEGRQNWWRGVRTWLRPAPSCTSWLACDVQNLLISGYIFEIHRFISAYIFKIHWMRTRQSPAPC